MKSLINISLFLLLLITACTEAKNEPSSTVKAETTIAKEQVKKTHKSDIEKMAFSESLVLLQGQWKSIDDPKAGITFTGTTKTDTYEGTKPTAGATFVIADRCQNTTNMGENPVRDRYLTLKAINQCFYIVNIGKDSLELSLVGRGNTIKYTKVN